MAKCLIGDLEFEYHHIKTTKSDLLLIIGNQGFLGCGYFDIETANKLEEAVAVVTGVQTWEQMLDKPVVRLSEAAKTLGITEGMSGRDALKRMV